ncbi:MAG: addiction module antidote protein, HigA family [Candidatus Magasanikbacteria bacterium CG_4_9_14_0_2_um_filter_42_11]|uniref:Addiction module antidote protein, HigA family n=1 Tax=Candidatus Magasanikbacteria bacterium CG_4_9_14_0_2_um_filter_42_11 TaxID=1974643 RepID=A0A2M8FAK5_9BACT|nr:MAG: addiction module antidote protein, HigA family [Candidatus Magasanikbacteria bacterium CG10_big_fil_rev_8_21_14_0_10_43_9]PIY92639.1 MAG: addiction module antidote protein, HigA family [Candidatus Magasanikbacteria bacterium CG_4_10_14_0_8_um_filter_42_12]PJC52738.1 MAG: addiction module antidote protein, HigA family [Candidatus Magasanikbacteria bacterium CG_4_9_14_0_2_um_filter_42_11]
MKKIPNIHPGEILQEEFLAPLNITAYRLSKETHIPATRISEIIHGRRSITADTALRFGTFFEVSPEFWLGLQLEYDLREVQQARKKDLAKISSYTAFVM